MHLYQQSLFATMLAIALASSPSLTFAASPLPSYKGHELAGQARVTIAQARQLALAARKGRIADEELERESGGSGLRYTFDIHEGKVSYEVGVDAVTGDILENQKEAAGAD